MNLPQIYHEFIMWIGDGTGAPDALLHVHAGMAILFLARIVTRRSLATPLPFLVVCAAEAANEVLDRLALGYWNYADALVDVANTLFWPFVLMVGLRWRRAHGSGDRPTRAEAAAAEPAPGS
jgi:hypothetical protein